MNKILQYKKDYNSGFFTLNNPVYTQIKYINASYHLQYLMFGVVKDVNIMLDNFSGSVSRIRKWFLLPFIIFPTVWRKRNGLKLLSNIIESCHTELSYLIETEQISDRTIKNLISIHFEKLKMQSHFTNYFDNRTVNIIENNMVNYVDNHTFKYIENQTINNVLIFNENIKIDSSYYEKVENDNKQNEFIFLQIKEFLLSLPISKTTKKRPYNKICRAFSYIYRAGLKPDQGNSTKNIELISVLLGIEDSISTTTYNPLIKAPHHIVGDENPINACNYLKDLLAYFKEIKFTKGILLIEEDIKILNNKCNI